MASRTAYLIITDLLALSLYMYGINFWILRHEPTQVSGIAKVVNQNTIYVGARFIKIASPVSTENEKAGERFSAQSDGFHIEKYEDSHVICKILEYESASTLIGRCKIEPSL